MITVFKVQDSDSVFFVPQLGVRDLKDTNGYDAADTSVEEPGTINWFNTTKGFDFITPDDGTKDVFVHVSQVILSGHTADSMTDGREIHFMRGAGRDGREIAINLRLGALAQATAPADRSGRRAGTLSLQPTGTVKWFNTTKGFGFIAPDVGGKDVFVHISAVEQSGLTGLADYAKVSYDLQTGRDGRESAVNLKLI